MSKLAQQRGGLDDMESLTVDKYQACSPPPPPPARAASCTLPMLLQPCACLLSYGAGGFASRAYGKEIYRSPLSILRDLFKPQVFQGADHDPLVFRPRRSKHLALLSVHRPPPHVLACGSASVTCCHSSFVGEHGGRGRVQGRDKECVIVSLVRANGSSEAGRLLTDWRRINVAMSDPLPFPLHRCHVILC